MADLYVTDGKEALGEAHCEIMGEESSTYYTGSAAVEHMVDRMTTFSGEYDSSNCYFEVDIDGIKVVVPAYRIRHL